MKAKLTDGRIITLDKDCECITHSGPHWLHENQLWHGVIKRQIDNLAKMSERDYLTYALENWIIEQQLERLAEKRRNMEIRGIEELLP